MTISNPVDVPVTANRATADGTATTADSDYTAIASSNVTLFAASSTTPFAISVNTTADSKAPRSLAERIRALDGDMSIRSGPRGATVLVQLPISE